ncbi:uncharacterized protein [Chelonus insularis]|uniref:uncharacterized protein n=1 Tax=Chelonus insularis TaxID=460826 RepID=UPI00158BE59A|nr:uncharacterized protein LOC118064584 [Chelonus insularis]
MDYTGDINDVYNMLTGNTGNEHENHVLVGEILEYEEIDDPLLMYHNYDQRNGENDEFELDFGAEDQPNITTDHDEDIDDISDLADDPLYDRAEITLRESMLAILSMALKYNLPKTCVEGMIEFGQLHRSSSERRKVKNG